MSTLRRLGREARTAARAAGLPPEMRPVRPGMDGGRYMPLSAAEVARIHGAALDVLEQIGLSDAPPSGVALLTATVSCKFLRPLQRGAPPVPCPTAFRAEVQRS